MAEKIGLEAVLEIKDFQKGLATYLAGIGKMQGQTAGVAGGVSTSLGGVNSAILKVSQTASSSVGSVGGFASALGSMATVAGGIVVAGIFEKIASGVSAFVSVGLEAVGQAQKLEAGLGALLTQNNLYERTTKEVTVAVAGFAEAQADAAGKADDLAFKQEKLRAQIDKQTASIQEQRQRIIQMGEGLNKNEAVAQLGVMETALKGLQRELEKAGSAQAKLSNIQQEYTTSTVTSYEQVNDFATAQKLATEQTQQLLAFVDKLSIISPFESEQVALVTKYAVGAGLAVDETKAFTAGFLDLAAAVGIGSEELAFASDQLLQVAKIGKITTIDLRQLRRLGIDLEKIIGVQMGMSIDEFNKKAEKSPDIFNDLFNEVAEFSSKTFPGAAKKLATSLDGIGSTFSDIFKISSKNLLRPLVDAVGPAMSEFLGRISDIATGPQLAAIGANIPKVLFGAFTSLQGEGEGDFFSGLKGLGLDSSTAKSITDITRSIRGVFDLLQTGDFKGGIFGLQEDSLPIDLLFKARDAVIGITNEVSRLSDIFQTGGLFGDAGEGGLLAALGLSPETVTTIQDTMDTIKGVISGISFSELTGAIAGIGTVLAGGVIVGAITGIGVAIAGLLTPLNLLIAGAAVLGAAWAGNWGNIQGIVQQAADFITQEWGTMASAVSAMTLGAMLGLDPESTAQILLGANAVIAILTSLGDWWVTNWPIMQAAALTAWVVIQGIFAGFQEVGLVASIQLQQAFTNITQGLANLGLNWTDVWNALKLATGIVLAGIGAILLGAVSAVGGLVVAVTSAISTMTSVWAAGAAQVTNLITGVTTMLVGVGQIWTGILTGDWSMAWQGYVLVFQGAIETVKGMLGILVTLFTGPFAIIYSIIEGFVTGVVSVFTGLYNTLVGNSIVPDLVNGIVRWFQQIPQKIVTALSGLVDMVTKPFEAVMDTASEIFNPEKWEDIGIGIIEGVVAGIESAKDQVLEVLKAMATDALSSVMDTLGIQSPSTEFQYIGQMMAAGVAKGWEDKKGDIFSQVLGMGDIGHMMGRGFSRTKAEEIKKGYKGALVTLWDEIVAGTKGAFDLEALTKQGSGNWAQFVKDADINFANVVETIRAGGAEIVEEMKAAIMNQALSMAQGFASFGDFLSGMLTEQRAAVQETIDSLSKLADENLKLSETLVTQEQKLAILNQELAELVAKENQDTIAIDKKRMAIAALTKEIDTNRAAMEANQKAMVASQKALEQMAFDEGAKGEEARIKLLQAFLEGKEKELVINKELTAEEIAAGVGSYNLTYDRVTAERELAELLKKQREEQEALAALEKSKADLAFLQQQVAILQLIKDNGLKVGDIFKDGIKFGLGANAADLMAATSKVIEAMIAQINDDLQVASPSRRLARIFRYAMEGAAMGVEQGQAVLDSAVRATPLLQSVVSPRMVSQPVLAGGGTSYNAPININGVTINNGMDMATFEQRVQRAVMRGMRG